MLARMLQSPREPEFKQRPASSSAHAGSGSTVTHATNTVTPNASRWPQIQFQSVYFSNIPGGIPPVPPSRECATKETPLGNPTYAPVVCKRTPTVKVYSLCIAPCRESFFLCALVTLLLSFLCISLSLVLAFSPTCACGNALNGLVPRQFVAYVNHCACSITTCQFEWGP